jgi:hypothetical protein
MSFSKPFEVHIDVSGFVGPTMLLGATRASLNHYFILRFFLDFFNTS